MRLDQWKFDREKQMLRAQLEKKQNLGENFITIENVLNWLKLRRERDKEDWFDFLDQTRSKEEKLWDKVAGKENDLTSIMNE